MKLILFITIILASYPIYAKEGSLPQYFDKTDLKLNDIPVSNELFLNAIFNIPNKHKTTGNGATIRIYEKINNKWAKTTSIKANPLLSTKDKIVFSGKINLTSAKNDIAIDSTIYHCGKYCVINNFQGIAKRNSKKSSKNLNFTMEGYLPTDKLKSI